MLINQYLITLYSSLVVQICLLLYSGFAAAKGFVKLVSMFGSQHENWEESNMADRSPMTDTSTDVDPDDQNRTVIYLTEEPSISAHLNR